MNFHRLRVFYTVAQQASFSRAAEALYTSQPNVSKHVRQLESELGTQLFHRLGSGIELTDAGRAVYRYAQRILDLTAEMERTLTEMQGLERGSLRLGASSTPGLYLLPEVVAAFGRRYPELDISLFVNNSERVVNEVLAGKMDLGFVGGFVEAAGLQVQPFVPVELVLIASPGHHLAGKNEVTTPELARETFIVREPGSGTRQAMDAALKTLGISPLHTMEMTSCEAIKRAVAAGLGLSFVSHYAIELELSQGVLTILHGKEITFLRQIHVVSRKDVRLSLATLAFLAFVHKQTTSLS